MPPVPRYLEIAADLRGRIAAGEFSRGLPPERVLRGQYETHQTTLRAALLIIEAEGLLVRRQGATHQVRTQPGRTLVDVDLPLPVKITARVATDVERERLGLPVGAWVIVVWDMTRLDDKGQPTVWDVVPAANTELLIGGAERPDDASD